MDLIGKTLLGKYRIEGLLGQGGMGSVWKGSHAITGRRVAIKVLDDRFLSNVNVVQRFGREARAASSIQHEGITEVLDLDQTEDGIPFLVMEFLQGETLSDRIEKRVRLPQAEVVRFAELLLDALEAAHEHGVVHRDLKPDNIFLVPAGRRGEIVKILDFGISHKDDEAASKLTVTGSVLGTPHYMSPEQAMGEADLDRRVDVYATAVVLYECLVGEVPFDAPNYNKLLRTILDEEPVPPSRRGAIVDARLEAVILKSLSKDRSQRAQTARALLNEIHAALRPVSSAGSQAAPNASRSAASFPRPGSARSSSSGALEAPSLPPLTDTAAPAASTPAFTVPDTMKAPQPAAQAPAGAASRSSAARPRGLDQALRSGGGLDILGDLEVGGAARAASLEIDEAALAQRASRTSVSRMRAVSEREMPALKSPVPSRPSAAVSGSHSVPPEAGADDEPPAPKAPLIPERYRAPLLWGSLSLLAFVLVVVGIRTVVQPGVTSSADVVPTGETRRPVSEPTRPGGDWVYIEVDGVPHTARLRLDGLPGATLPLRVRRGGRHVLEIHADGYEDRRIEFEALAGTRLRANMRPATGTILEP